MPRNLKVSICTLQNVHDGDLLVNTCLQEITMHICIITHFFSSALMHIAKLHVAHLAVLSCVLVVVQNHNLWKSCTLVGGACVLHVCQSFRDNSVFLSISFDVLFCVLPSITKKGEIESTFAPWVVLVINDNILCGWTNAFIKYVSGNSITLAWQKDWKGGPLRW